MSKSCSKKISKSVNFVKNNTYVLPPGNYFIGDPSYFLNDYIQENVCSGEPGHYSLPDGRGIIIMDSCYSALVNSKNDKYNIDSGYFGIFSVDFGDISKFTGDGTFHTFRNHVSFNYKNGEFELKCGSKTIVFEPYEYYSDDDGYDSVG